MTNIHPTAVVDPSAQLGTNVQIGPFCVIGPHVVLGDGVVAHSHAVIAGHTTLGPGCKVFSFASIGQAPQDAKFHDEPSTLTVGAGTVIRENVTINPGTEGGLMHARGDNCLLMIASHIAHDCQLGDNVTLVNGATLGGHVSIGDGAIIGGLSAIHQFVRIGAYSFVGGMSGVAADLIPFGMALGNRANLNGLNIVGMKRKGFPREQIHEVRQAYRMLFSSEGTLKERLKDTEAMFSKNPLAKQIIDFIKSESDRSFCVPNNAATPSR
ncbi:acyl-[acyl-carrier-protein]--UDP-N-acetylglucosamine O-acyltransferase [Methyloceanibacter superfactus]|uniref:Acyl-[acyl-carrier-protein]--UDP-N-acetylglucosamine O-acyltransferase n=1 Tax=Methyloceanibacter superfactus TaxID=1774969 RepID=A0A1E3VPB6_9HYPH|nr:acyl-ACP--UDP-N-acetylglucosamine O-acyltransferase [Methyloceanibacter superfactus]ODR95385.1 acyl-[acyl-carrier-protein]--UDP-N-acetylglucosamine O-acyltransferase [Methyloceanibacter superfactus]